ncbi:M15 family metallopeptidase [Butyrivibrio sp. INlla16]|uniref:M15 family metallopeptidase n=1 Tax=Butyrivibrio sp. INlla16 TaxID=1520807 RepID=UPI000889B7E7|nr:M15 family metallopeptidase [Butyrivibrio sp. INlla16]SDB34962.1 D-alanyl-D-alanine dipeptidase [Butyrivibrio sp. INlla16]
MKDMKDMKNHSENQDSSGFVKIPDVAGDVILEIRYYSTFNFIGDRIDGYTQPTALLTKEAAAALKAASDEAINQGYRLKIYDAYRPQRAVDHFVRWAKDLEDQRMKKVFYPEVPKEKLFTLGFIAEHSGHSRGSTVDLTLFDMSRGCDVDMGGYFDFFGDISHYDHPDLTDAQRAGRALLRDIMLHAGFEPYENEWWHFTLANEPYPNTYFDLRVE